MRLNVFINPLLLFNNQKTKTSMKKVSVKVFFTVVWRGLCQAVGRFFGLFGYKCDGKFAKCVWSLFATSAAVIMALFACMLVYSVGKDLYDTYRSNHHHCELTDCCDIEWVGGSIYYHNPYQGKKFVYDALTGEKTLKHVAWIAKPLGQDSLVCFSDGEKRGYFNKNTGKVVIEPKYSHAWIFSDGLASVEEDGYIKFIDATGKVIIDNKMPYHSEMDGYVFHGGYCIVPTENGEMFGLMDKTGKWVLPQEYSFITSAEDNTLWRVVKGEQMAVLNQNLNPILSFMEGSIFIGDGTIDVTMPDHTMRKYDMRGELINDFYVSCVRLLEYEKDEILRLRQTRSEYDDDYEDVPDEYYHPKATARLRSYTAGDSYEGLMTAEGHIVTMPIYKDIEAIGPDLYLCSTTNYDKVVVNGKGEIIR